MKLVLGGVGVEEAAREIQPHWSSRGPWAEARGQPRQAHCTDTRCPLCTPSTLAATCRGTPGRATRVTSLDPEAAAALAALPAVPLLSRVPRCPPQGTGPWALHGISPGRGSRPKASTYGACWAPLARGLTTRGPGVSSVEGSGLLPTRPGREPSARCPHSSVPSHPLAPAFSGQVSSGLRHLPFCP